MKHTKGPWKIYQASAKTIIETELHTIDSPRKYLAIIEDGNLSDAHLIAAAPEMLQLLEYLSKQNLRVDAWEDRIAKIIKKAKGE